MPKPKYTKTSQNITKKAVEKHRRDILGGKDFDIVTYLYVKEFKRANDKKLKQAVIEAEK